MFDEAISAFLPTNAEWCTHDFPHMTLVYAGAAEDMDSNSWNSFAKDSISAARVMRGPFSLPVTGVEELGDTEKVDALIMHPSPQLLVARHLMEKWNKSEFKDFLPHATIGPAGSAFTEAISYHDGAEDTVRYKRQTLPHQVHFNRMAICLGPKRLVFDLSDLY